MSATLRALPAWQALERHRAEVGTLSLRALFAADPGRAERMTCEGAGWILDTSKHLATARTLELLVALAEAVDVRGRAEAMFRGEKINTTENRAVLHTALRAPRGTRIEVD